MGIERLGLHPGAARATWTVAVVLLVLWALYQIRETLFILILAVFFSYMVYPLVEVVHRRVKGRTSHTGAIAIVYLVVMACLMLAAIAIGSRIVTEASSLAAQLPAVLQDPQWMQRIPIPHAFDAYRPQIETAVRSQISTVSDNMVPLLRQFGGDLLGYAGNVVYVVLIPVLSFLLSRDAPDLRRGLLDWIQDREWWHGILNDLNVLLAGYMRALLLMALATTLIFSAFLTVIGVPYSVLLGVLAGMFEFVPMLGPLSAAAIIIAVALFSGFGHIAWVIVFLVAYRMFEDYVLSPFLMSSGAEVSPLLVILGVLAGEHLGGVPGMILSIPAVATIRILAIRMREEHALEIAPPLEG